MSRQTIDWLRTKVLVGDCDLHGNPWHSADVKVTTDNTTNLYPGAVPVNSVRKLFDFPILSSPVQFAGPDGNLITTDRQAVFHGATGDLFGIFTDGWQLHPYTATLLDNTATIVQESAGDLHVDSAGLLANGAEAWLSIATQGLLSVHGVDYWPHIIAATSCNGKRATVYKAVNTLAVCDNTLAAAMGENGATFKLKHTKYSVAKLADARDALQLLDLTGDAMAAQITELVSQTVTDQQWAAFVEALAPITDDTKAAGRTRAEREREELATLYNGDPRVEPWRGTAFGALQAANVHDLWFRGTRNAGDDAQQAKADRVISEAIAGKLAERETERANTLQAILANV